jgi:hypothetical protein
LAEINSKGQAMTTVDRLHELDALLHHLARQRRTAAEADAVALAEKLEADWRAVDQQRQELRAAAADAELIQYEVDRKASSQWV